MSIMCVTVNSGGFLLYQSLLFSPGSLTRLEKNVRSCVSAPVEYFLQPQSQLPGLYPLLHFIQVPSIRNLSDALECLLAEAVSQQFSTGNPLDLSNLVVSLLD